MSRKNFGEWLIEPLAMQDVEAGLKWLESNGIDPDASTGTAIGSLMREALDFKQPDCDVVLTLPASTYRAACDAAKDFGVDVETFIHGCVSKEVRKLKSGG